VFYKVQGILKGFDGLLNLVLDEAKELLLRSGAEVLNPTRELGLIVVRGPQIVVISPTDGTEEIANPFLQAE
jgi:U6 snRNA-associated Sm-like protein LSm7